MFYDILVSGYKNNIVNIMRLWFVKAFNDFKFYDCAFY